MKIYTPTSELIRIRVMRKGEKDSHVVLEEATLLEVYDFVYNLFQEYPYKLNDTDLHRTKIEVREYKDKKNGKSKCFYFFGLSTEEVKQLILKQLCTN